MRGQMSTTHTERIENYTPHPVWIIHADGERHLFLPVGVVRTFQIDVPDGEVSGVPVVRAIFSEVGGLPKPRPGVWLVVSTITAQAARAGGRSTDDLLLTSGPVRDADGNIIGYRQLARLH